MGVLFGFKLLRRLVSLLVIVAIALPLYIGARIWWAGSARPISAAEAIVVMGAAQYDGRPGPVLLARLERALTAYEEGLAPSIITVGGRAPGDRKTEADAAEHWLRLRGVPPRQIVAIPEGRDTWTSTLAYVEFAQTKGWTSVLLVTDPWHCFRSTAMARSRGLTAGCAPSTGSIGGLSNTQYFSREIIGYLAFVVLGERIARVPS
jgi:uncharacterized SAM-binding protein YcdF (DUF218 family)